MIDFIYIFLSALLGLVIINGVIIGNAHLCRKGLLGGLPVEVRYVALLLLVFVILLNANQLVAGNQLFLFIAVGGLASLVISIKKMRGYELRLALFDFLSILAVQLVTLFVLIIAYKMHNYWLLESQNHDSIFYYQGLRWASESPLFVAKDAVRARWNLGDCGDASSWIGYNCSLYRGGTYTLISWVQYFAPHSSGNGLYFIASYAATFVWFAVKLGSGNLEWKKITIITCFITTLLALVVTLSSGLIGALLNSNLATVMAGSTLALIVSLALRKDLSTKARYVLMTLACTVSSHFYAESVFYAGLIVSLLFILELRLHIRELYFVNVIRLAALLLLIILLAGNIPLGQAFSSLLFFGEEAKGGEWFSWYIHQFPIFWIGSFIAGLLLNTIISVPIVIFATTITILSVLLLLQSNQTRSGTLALIITSFLAVLYVEVTDYQYGEHKVIHLLGPAWSLIVVTSILRLIEWDSLGKFQFYVKYIVLCCFFSGLILFSISSLLKSYLQIDNMREAHGLDFGVTNLTSYIRPGDNVILDDSAWLGVETFQKSHYLIFQLHDREAEVLMPDISGDTLRGGYFRGNRHDTFSLAENVDWLVKSRSYSMNDSMFNLKYATPTWENKDYSLFKVSEIPLAVPGNGWYQCETTHCWTLAPFVIETFAPSKDVYKLSIEFSLFNPPEKGTITVSTSDGQLLAEVNSDSKNLLVELPQGWTRLVYESSWPISSPRELGVSEDSRRLFMAVQSVSILPVQEIEAE